MMYKTMLPSPIGPLLLASDGQSLTGLWLEEQKYFAAGLNPKAQEMPALPVFRETELWLNDYFAGKRPPSLPPLAAVGSCFRQAVWRRLLEIPYGETRTYGDIAAELVASPRAVGAAVGHNPISILIPCHRVLGADGSLTGYAGGVEKKRFLLALESTNLPELHASMVHPKTGNDSSIQEEAPPVPGKPGQVPSPKKFPCPCCGCKTFPVPKEDAVAYICPVCFWENDVFDPGEDQPSDENHSMTLRQGRDAFRRMGAVRKEFLQYVRKPLPEEIS